MHGVTRGGFYDGTLNEVSWRGRVEFGPQFLVEPTISLNYFDTPYGTGDSHLVSARITYTLTPRMFVSALLQYTSATEQASVSSIWRLDARAMQVLTDRYRNDTQLIGKVFRQPPGWTAVTTM